MPTLEVQHQIVCSKAKQYFESRPGPDDWKLIDQKWQFIHHIYPGSEQISEHAQLGRLLSGATTHASNLKLLNNILDYRITVIRECDELISFLPFKAPKLSEANVAKHLAQAIFAPDAGAEQQAVYWRACVCIKNSRLFTETPIGCGPVFEKPIQHLAIVLMQQCGSGDELGACVRALKALKKKSRAPLRQYPSWTTVVLRNTEFIERARESQLRTCLEDWKRLRLTLFPEEEGKGEQSPTNSGVSLFCSSIRGSSEDKKKNGKKVERS